MMYLDSCREVSACDNEDESEFVEIEPKFKYARLMNDVQTILAKDSASCIAVHPKFICIGSHSGNINVFDHQGNNIGDKELQAHTAAVNQLSIDQNGEYIASCSNDGKVLVTCIYSTEHSDDIAITRLVKSVAIDPYFLKSGFGRRIVTGDEQLVLHEKTYLSRVKSTVICEAEGGVKNIKWNGKFIAWATDDGVRVYDVDEKCSLGCITWDRKLNTLPRNYQCSLCWISNVGLLIGWGDTVRICCLRKRNPIEVSKSGLPEYKIQPVSTFVTDFYICGLGPLDNLVVILGYIKETDENGKAQRPQLYVVEPRTEEYIEICINSLSLKGYQEYNYDDYHLEYLVDDNYFFVVSPKDVVTAVPYDVDDRLQWLVEHRKFEAAMQVVTQYEGRSLKKYNAFKVGRAYVDHLLSLGKYQQAGDLCFKILGKDKSLWEEEVYKFARVHQLRAVSDHLPCAENPLPPLIYEMVLYECLKMEPERFLRLIKEWPPTLFSVPAVVNAVLEHFLLKDKENTLLLEALAILYSHEKQYDKALATYLKLRNKGVFQLIHKHNLYNSIHNVIEELIKLDSEQAISMLLEKDKISSDIIVASLEHNEYYLCLYLDALDKIDAKEASKYHGLLVKLYADFARHKLLSFLRCSDQYPIQEALDICYERSFYPEMVYLLGRIGNTKEALVLIIQQLGDIDHAVNFCKEHDDTELWQELIKHSQDRPEYITFLLQKVGTYIDPRILLQRIESGLRIDGLKSSLVKMIQDYNLQVSVQEGCKKILVSDYFNIHKKLIDMQQRGISVEDDHMCGACHRKLIPKDLYNTNGIVMFYCKHAFHVDCLPASNFIVSCAICNSGLQCPTKDNSRCSPDVPIFIVEHYSMK